MSRSDSSAQHEWWIKTGARFTLNIFIYLIKTFYLYHFLLEFLNYTKAFSNIRPINIYFYTIHLQNGVSCLYKMIHKTIVQSLTLLFTKYHMFKRNDMYMAGYILIRCNFLYDSMLLNLGLLFYLLETCA